MNNEPSFIAYLKYNGRLVEDGYFDARKSAEVLLGFDEIIRYFFYQIDPGLQLMQFELPVRIQKGSWETIIPSDIKTWLETAGGIGLIKYLTTSATNKVGN